MIAALLSLGAVARRQRRG
ncbi:MAG: hypothetical protein K8R60_01500 [Burkholderiales bacterium]|nr:hypothetical protein [Burkholderiales bacterium]